MPGEREPGTGPPPEIKPNLQTAIELANQYGGIDKIPDGELASIGYARKPDGSIAPKEIVEKFLKDQAEKITTVEDKTKIAPFGEITVPLTSQETDFRRLGDRNLNKFIIQAEDIYDEIALESAYRLEDVISRYLPSNYRYQNLFNGFKKFAEEKIKNRELEDVKIRNLLHEIFYNNSFLQILIMLESPSDEEISQGSRVGFYDFRYSISHYLDEEGNLPTNMAEKLYNDLEREKGFLADKTELNKIFIKHINDPIIEPNQKIDQAPFPELEKYNIKHGIDSRFKLSIHFFTMMLEDFNFKNLAEKFKQVNSPQETAKILIENRDEALSPAYTDMRALTMQIKTAPFEQKKLLSSQLKELKEKFETQKTIIDGLIEYYNFPELASQILLSRIKHIQDILVAKKGEEKETTITLDGKPNADLDRDPGVVSGDCTAGHPLPFADPNTPVFNIKVFDHQKSHIGNIYLLETTNMDENPVWHLDAIQIPQYSIEWNSAIANIMNAIGKEAAKENIFAVTSNNVPDFISNYDYISTAVEAYWQKIGAKETQINIPEIDDDVESRYSSFQGNGEARVLWSAGPE